MTTTPQTSGKAGTAAEHLASMTLVEHLTELRSRLIKAILAVAVGALVMWFIYPAFVDTLRDLLVRSCPDEAACRVVASSPIQGLATRMTVSAYGGVGVALPFIMWQLWQFITPGLYKREKRLAAPFVIASFLLFLLGTGLAWITIPKAMFYLARFGGNLDQFYAINEYTSFVVKTAVGFGIGFQFPVVLVFLQLVGMITPQRLAKWRRFAIVLIVVAVAVITPGGDLFSLFALSIPMYVMYEGSILFGKLRQRRQRKRAAQPA